jgi:hypothetical protein
MSKQCRLCGGLAEFVGKNVFGEDVYECTICKETGHHSRFDDITLFTEITKSPEVLAETYVHQMWNAFNGNYKWTSTLLTKRYPNKANLLLFDSKEEAIQATIAELEESEQSNA